MGKKIKWKKKKWRKRELYWLGGKNKGYKKRRKEEGIKEKIAKNKTTNYLIDILCHIIGCDSLELFYLILITLCKNSHFMLHFSNSFDS